MRRLIGRQFARIDTHLGILGRLVRIAYSGELLEDSRARLRVKAFSVPLLARFQRRRGFLDAIGRLMSETREWSQDA